MSEAIEGALGEDRIVEQGDPLIDGSVAAYSGDREHLDRSIVNTRIGDRDRSGATLDRFVGLLAFRPPSAGTL
jgi:hypothetical protein